MIHDLLRATDHRPWPLPDRPWRLRMSWHDLLFLHWAVPDSALRPLLPRGLDLDLRDGSAWLGIVPFRMVGTRIRWLPAVPTATNFPELNVRTYVRRGDRAGVWFFSLDAASRLAVCSARAAFHLPYFVARMTTGRDGGEVHYRSERIARGAPAATFAARWRSTAPFARSAPGSLAAWLTERYCLFAADRRGGLHAGDIHHRPWQLAPAAVALEACAMTRLLGCDLAPEPASALAAAPIDVLAFGPRRIA